MPIVRRRCPDPACAREWDLLDMKGELSALDHDDIDHIGCPACGRCGDQILGAALPWDLVNGAGGGRPFPYYDHGLGCEVRDAAHHRWLMEYTPAGEKRPARLRPTDGDLDWEEIAAESQRATEASERRYRENQDELINGPNKAAYGKLMEIIRSSGTKLWDERAGRG